MTGDDAGEYKVVANHERQYSIWFADRENPPGWEDAGLSRDMKFRAKFGHEVPSI